MFLVFPSAFNTVQPHLLLKKLLCDFELSPPLALWILDFLLDRPLRVCVNGCVYSVYIHWFTSGLCPVSIGLHLVCK